MSSHKQKNKYEESCYNVLNLKQIMKIISSRLFCPKIIHRDNTLKTENELISRLLYLAWNDQEARKRN